MNTKISLFIVAFASIGAAFATDLSNAATRSSWFGVTMSNVKTSDLKTAPWSTASGATATIENSKLNLDSTADKPVTYTPTTPTTAAYHEMNFKVTSTYWDVAPAAPASTFGALVIIKSDNVLRFAGLVKNGDAAAWKVFTTVTAADATEYDLLIECDEVLKKVRYSVKANGADSYTILSETVSGTTTTWFESPAPTAVSKVAFAGCGVFGDFSGTNVVEARPIPVSDDSGLSPKVDDSWLKAKAKAAGVADSQTYLSGQGSNGLKVYQSYVLGLDPNTDNSKPIIKTVQNSASDKVAFQLGCRDTVKTDANVNVTFTVTTMDSPDGASVSVSDPASAKDGTIELDLPASGVKYYKLNLKFDNPPSL